MSVEKIITGLITLLALAAAFENFGKVGFNLKLIALSIIALITLYISTNHLTKWVKKEIKPKPKIKKTISVVGSIIICIIFVVASLLIKNYYTIQIEEMTSSDDKFKFRIRGAVHLASKVSVQLPPRTKTICLPKDHPKHRADSLMENWNSANPQLQLSNFSYPQSIFLECAPRIDFNSINIRIEPPNILVLFPSSSANYRILIFSIGGILCIASLVFFFICM